MNKKRVILSALTTMFCVMVMNFTSLANNPETSQLSLYQEIIDKINSEYNTSFEIEDEENFTENVIEKISLVEFEEQLISDAIDFSQNETEVETEVIETDEYNNPMLRTGVSYVKMSCIVSKGSYLGKVYAEFEIIDLSTLKKFNKLTSAGHIGHSGWYYKSIKSAPTSFSTSKCTIKYSGYWCNGTTGLREAMDYSYSITYTP